MLNKITAKWEPIGQIPKVYADRTFKMRSMQAEAYAALADKRHVIINAPTASGKTLAICWILAKRLIESPQRKAIIAVPQTIIASGFRGYFNLSFTNETDEKIDSLGPARWSPAHYLCRDTKESNISQLLSFLGREGNKADFNDRVIICSHASLIDAFQQRPDLFKCADICVDEAHHIKYTVLDDEEEAEFDEDHTAIEFCNRMGELVSHSLKSADVSLILSTATLFRGDRLEIIPREKISEFERFHYPMDAYLRDCHWLESFSYDFAMYEDRWSERMAEIFKESIGRTIVYLPSVGSKYYSYGSKEKDLKQIYRAIAGGKPQVKEEKSGLTLIKRGDKWVKVVNLVDDTPVLREKRKELIIAAHDGDGSDIDVIVALNMFREGANWKWADREIIIGAKGSLTDMNQILGRLFRDAKDKKHVHAIQLLPFSFDQLNKDKFRDHLNEYSKVIFATMLIEDAIAPVDLRLPVRRDARTGRTVTVDHLRDQVDDENVIFTIWEEIRDAAIKAHDNKVVDFGKNDEASRKMFADITSEVLTRHEVMEFHAEIAEAIRRRWIREAIKKVGGVDLSSVDFDVVQINPLQHFLTYSSEMCGLDTFSKFRAAFEKYGWSETYNLEVCYPEVAKEWHPTKNGRLRARDFAPMSDFKARWRGKCGHEWVAPIKNRTSKKTKCPYCSRHKTAKENSLLVVAPDIAKEWHISKNGDLLPSEVSAYSNKKAWFICKNGHEINTVIAYRVGGNYCRQCARQGIEWPSFQEAKNHARKLGLKNEREWSKYVKANNLGFPVSADRIYAKQGEWKSWADFLGTKNFKRGWASFEAAKTFARTLLLNSEKQWRSFCAYGRKPDDIPHNPDQVYKKSGGWESWADFLGAGRERRKLTITYNEAKEVVRLLNIKQAREYFKRRKENKLLPSCPDKAFKSEWVSWGEFLRTTESS